MTLGELAKKVTNSKSKKMVEKYEKEWGSHIVIHQDKNLRNLVAEATARRLGLSPVYTKMRFNTFYKLGVFYESSVYRRRGPKA